MKGQWVGGVGGWGEGGRDSGKRAVGVWGGGSRCWSQVHRLFPHGRGSCLCPEKTDLGPGSPLRVDLTVSLAGSGAGPEEGQALTGP